MRRFLPGLLVICLILLLFGLGVFGSPKTAHSIIDISWPNCKKIPYGYAQGIVGATGGLDYHVNPCLSEETASLPAYALYMNSGYPGENIRKNLQDFPFYCSDNNEVCHAYNYGYNAAVYAIRQAALHAAHSRTWWIDVESDNSWSASPEVNRANLLGMVAAIEKNVFLPKIGFYSYPGQWVQITHGWKNGLPAWTATGQLESAAADAACRHNSFTGGPQIFAQYTDKLDINVLCPSASLQVMPI
jgi:hypothetical protein